METVVQGVIAIIVLALLGTCVARRPINNVPQQFPVAAAYAIRTGQERTT